MSYIRFKGNETLSERSDEVYLQYSLCLGESLISFGIKSTNHRFE